MDKTQIDKLAKKAVRGNTKAYGQLVHTYQEYLYKTAFLYVKNEDTALDVVQDSILKAYENIHTLREPQYFKTWLTRILINCANGYLRRNKQTVDYQALEAVAGPSSLMVEEKWDLYDAIDELPEKLKTVIILKYYNDLKVSEIAGIMDIPEGSVKAYLSRAREELKRYLKEDYVYA